MDIKFEKTGNVNGEITITINKEDYAPRVEKALKDYRKRASVPGFRPGQAPMGMLKKRFGNEVTAEEVQKLLGEKLYGYIREQKINILGEPLSNNEKTPEINFETMDQFTFVFDIALAPEFDAKLSENDTVDYYTIQVTDEMVDQQVQMYASRGGEYQKVDEYQTKDMVKGTLTQLDENGEAKADGVVKEGAVMLPEYMKNDEQKALFNGAKVGATIVLNPAKAYDNNEVEISSMLGIDKAEVANCQGDFKFEISEITRFQPAALTQDLFDQVLGKDAVKSEEEFRAAIKQSLEEQFKSDSQFKFMLDLRTYLTGRVGALEYPDEMLKKIMQLNNQDKDEKFVEDNFEKSKDELTWHLIKEQLSDQFEVKVEQADVMETAKQRTRVQFAQYGMSNVPEQMLNQYAGEMLKNKQQAENLVYRTVENKIAAAALALVKLNKKEVSLDDFNKMFQPQQA